VVADGQRHATVTERIPERWSALAARTGHGMVEFTPLSRTEQADEVLLMGLRLTEGVDLDRLAAIGGLCPRRDAVDALVARGLLERRGMHRLRATPAGRLVLNEIVLRLSSAFEEKDASVEIEQIEEARERGA
jgi:oxygen-independent coproporphyrinogen-3 oxidase